MHLLDYDLYMHWKQFDMLLLDLASKLGFHPLTKASLGCYCYYTIKTATLYNICVLPSYIFGATRWYLANK
jgi:hypothetical protein